MAEHGSVNRAWQAPDPFSAQLRRRGRKQLTWETGGQSRRAQAIKPNCSQSHEQENPRPADEALLVNHGRVENDKAHEAVQNAVDPGRAHGVTSRVNPPGDDIRAPDNGEQ